MAGPEHKNWRGLANAALEAKDPDKLLEIVQELNKVLKHEEQVRRDFRGATRINKSSREIRLQGGILVENWHVIQDEATEEQSKSGNPMFGSTFPVYA
jgi:hypothetical protein